MLLTFSFNIQAQEDTAAVNQTIKELLEKSETQFEEKNYLDALDGFTSLNEQKPKDLYYKMMMGICLTYDPAQKRNL